MQNAVGKAKFLLSSGQPEQALATLESRLADNPGDLSAHILAASALIRMERGSQALPHLERCAEALDDAPNPVRARCTLAMNFANAGDVERAAGLLEQAEALAPGDHEVMVRRADLLAKMDQWDQALAQYRAVLADLPDHAGLHASAGIAAHQLGHLDEATQHYIKALNAVRPQRNIYNNLLACLVAQGRHEEAYRHAGDWLGHAPANVEAMAFHSLLAVQTGDTETAGTWFDFDTVVDTLDIPVPEGYASLDEFNRALEADILAYPELKTPPEDHPTWHHPALKIGSQINAGTPGGPIAALEHAMHAGVEAYLADKAGRDHPFFAARPARYDIEAWAAVLEGQGNQLPHIHKSGYLSGCYYVTIPDEIDRAEPGPDGRVTGGFEMGRPPVELSFQADFPARTLKPHEGMMVLFPAYLYHGTVPFQSSRRRICVAFDVIPQR